jgi:hypothetical protein
MIDERESKTRDRTLRRRFIGHLRYPVPGSPVLYPEYYTLPLKVSLVTMLPHVNTDGNCIMGPVCKNPSWRENWYTGEPCCIEGENPVFVLFPKNPDGASNLPLVRSGPT